MSKKLFFLLCLGAGLVAFAPSTTFGQIYDIPISIAGDDREEQRPAGNIANNSDLEMPYEDTGKTTEQVIGLRFQVPIAQGAKVVEAYVVFTVDETKGGTEPVNLLIDGHVTPDAGTLTSSIVGNLTVRTPLTTTKVPWAVPNWTAAGEKSQTPDLSGILNEIFAQPNWKSGNSLVLIFRDDKSKPSSGVRAADAFEDGNPPVLHIRVATPLPTVPNPADGAGGVSMPLLGWTAGDGAALHNVYFGTSQDLTEANLVAPNQPFAMYYHGPGIEPGVTYYWRVDEIDAAGVVTPGPVWSFTAASLKAYDPSPKNSGKYVAVDAKLTWTPGYGGQFHTVYFGTSFADVNNATGGTQQVELSYTPAAPLTKGTTYYWRVDESDGAGKTVYKGDVWSFTAMPDIKITDPDLVGWWTFDEDAGNTAIDFSGHGNDGTLGGTTTRVPGIMGGALDLNNGYVSIDGVADDVKSTNLTISIWIKTIQSIEGEVFGLNDGSGNHPLLWGINSGQAFVDDDGTGQTFAPTVLNDNQWHMYTYVRSGSTGTIYLDGIQIASYDSTFSLDTVTRWSIGMEWDSTPGDFYKGLVDDARVYNKALTVDEVKELMRGDPALAWKPSPDNKALVDVLKVEQGLSWTAGDNAAQHDVYFGLEKAAVEAATASDQTGIYRGRQAEAAYTPTETLAWGSGPYFWRVDEVQADGTITTGSVWSFTVADFLVVDDMESYTDVLGTAIFDTWVDGYTDKNSNSTVGYMGAPFAETKTVHGGRQSMPMDYDNSIAPFFSEAVQTFAPLQNWTTNDVNTLSLWFRGNPVKFADKGNGAFTVSGSGHDIWDNADDFRFVYKQLTGNGSIVAKVESIGNTNVWAKGGVMIRESLQDGSPMAYMIQSAASGASFGWRINLAGTCGSNTASTAAAPQWVKLTRTGTAFTAQYSADGKTWTDIKDATTGVVTSTTVSSMAGTVYIGLCVTSHDAALTTTAEFSGVATTGNVTGAWEVAEIGDDPEPGNNPDPVYLAVADNAGKSATVTHPDPGASALATWTQWKIPLSSLTGINLAKVKELYVGVGDKKAPTAGGSGRIFIDDITLTKP